MKLLKKILLAFVLLLMIGITNSEAKAKEEKININGDTGSSSFRSNFNAVFSSVLGDSGYTIIVDGAQNGGSKSTITLDENNPLDLSLLSLGSRSSEYMDYDNRWQTWGGTIIFKNLNFVGKESFIRYIL